MRLTLRPTLLSYTGLEPAVTSESLQVELSFGELDGKTFVLLGVVIFSARNCVPYKNYLPKPNHCYGYISNSN